MVNPSLLEKLVNKQRNSLTTDRLDMSYGEIISMYESGDIIISPQFQRLFRWNIEQRTRLIESILLGIPIPPIFVAEDKDGRWELVDGLQRLSTIITFFGLLKDDRQDDNYWIMEAGDLVKELEGYDSMNLPEKFMRNIKRTYCRVEIIKWDSQYDMRYELFNRLNTGGEPLKPQEIRNCIFRGISDEFNLLLNELAQNSDFQNLIDIPENKKKELFDEELVLRFFAILKSDLEKIQGINIEKLMTEYMRETVSNPIFNYEEAKNLFNRTINILKQFDSNIFRSTTRQLSTGLYEGVMVGTASNIDYYETHINDLKHKIDSLPQNTKFKKNMGSASSSKTRVLNRTKTALKHFEVS